MILDAVRRAYWPTEWRSRPVDPQQAMTKARARLADYVDREFRTAEVAVPIWRDVV